MLKNVKKGGKTIDEELEKNIKEWVRIRKESFERKNNKKDPFIIQTESKINGIIDKQKDENKEEVSDMLEELIYLFMNYSYEENQKYYQLGFGDCFKIIIETLKE